MCFIIQQLENFILKIENICLDHSDSFDRRRQVFELRRNLCESMEFAVKIGIAALSALVIFCAVSGVSFSAIMEAMMKRENSSMDAIKATKTPVSQEAYKKIFDTCKNTECYNAFVRQKERDQVYGGSGYTNCQVITGNQCQFFFLGAGWMNKDPSTIY